MRRLASTLIALVWVSCSGPSPTAQVVPTAETSAASFFSSRAHDDHLKLMTLEPKSLTFVSPSSPPQDAYVGRFHRYGNMSTSCTSRVVAQVGFGSFKRNGRVQTIIVMPLAAGKCEATFYKGRQHRTLRISVGQI
jgi:hypothetical protein